MPFEYEFFSVIVRNFLTFEMGGAGANGPKYATEGRG